MGERVYRDWHPGNRRYYLKASDIYAQIMSQRGYAACGGHAIRRYLREHLSGRTYIAHPGKRHLVSHDEIQQTPWANQPYPHELKRHPPGSHFVERYHRDHEATRVARELPFRCPLCASDKNPLASGEYRVPYRPGEQIVCVACWEGIAWRIEVELDDIKQLIIKLNKEIGNAQERKRGSRQRREGAGSPRPGRHLRHDGPAEVAHPGISGSESGQDHAEQSPSHFTDGSGYHGHIAA
jgi:hypothetical protein